MRRIPFAGTVRMCSGADTSRIETRAPRRPRRRIVAQKYGRSLCEGACHSTFNRIWHKYLGAADVRSRSQHTRKCQTKTRWPTLYFFRRTLSPLLIIIAHCIRPTPPTFDYTTSWAYSVHHIHARSRCVVYAKDTSMGRVIIAWWGVEIYTPLILNNSWLASPLHERYIGGVGPHSDAGRGFPTNSVGRENNTLDIFVIDQDLATEVKVLL